jgi:hypothetical protein
MPAAERPDRATDEDEPRDDLDDASERPPSGAPHKGGVILGLGITSLVLAVLSLLGEGCTAGGGSFCGACCGAILLVAWLPLVLGMVVAVVGAILGLIASLLGRRDLAKIDGGLMDESGRGSTKSGMICGIIGTVLCVLDLLCGVAVLILWIAGFSAMVINAGSNPQ